jgi:creatinine amidohydrolase
MSWKWEELTAPDFVRARDAAARTVVVPLGVLEKHGNHLPVGTDMLFVTRIAEMAVALEPVILFPTFIFGQIMEGKPYPGTIAIRHELMAALLDNLLDELARNGFEKIILLNGHGGNESFLGNFTFSMLQRQRPFTLYVARLAHYMAPITGSDEWQSMMVTKVDNHGGEMETSLMMAVRPDLVKMEDMVDNGQTLGRLAHLPAQTPIWWYSDHPNHYAGDATHATPEKGEYLMSRMSARLAEIFTAVKADTEAPRLQAEFFERSQH